MFTIITHSDVVSPDSRADAAADAELDRYLPAIRQLSDRPLPYPRERFHGRGIITAAGGRALYTCAYVLVNRLRQLGCELPVQVWYRGPSEMSRYMRSLLEAVPNVTCVDAFAFQRRHPETWTDEPLSGFQLKSYAMVHNPFREVLFIDADNVPVADPTYLFDDATYRDVGAVFWPDRYAGHGEGARYRSLADEAWRTIGLSPRDEAEFETGQMLVDKRRCWRELHLALFLNEHSDFFYRWMHGDKDTFHLAWERLETAYAMPARGVEQPGGNGPALYQHDLQGRRIFQHRMSDKWDVGAANVDLPDYVGEAECHRLKHQLAGQWDGIVRKFPWDYAPREREAFEAIIGTPVHCYGKSADPADERLDAVRLAREAAADGCDAPGQVRPLELGAGFWVGRGATPLVSTWRLEPTHRGEVQLVLADKGRRMAELRRTDEKVWAGRQVRFSPVAVALAAPQHAM